MVYYVGCTDVICNFVAQMLLSIMYGTGVIMPISYNVLLAQMLLCIIYGQNVDEPFFLLIITSFSVLGC